MFDFVFSVDDDPKRDWLPDGKIWKGLEELRGDMVGNGAGHWIWHSGKGLGVESKVPEDSPATKV